MMSEDKQLKTSGICLVSFSRNADHQNALYAMFNALDKKCKVSTVGAKDPIAPNAAHTERNIYVECPDRPGVTKGTFNFGKLMKVAKAIRSTGCSTVYFESVHLWNCFLIMLLGCKYRSIATLHDPVPHDGSKSVLACQRLLCRLASHVVVKSPEFVEDAKRLYSLPDSKVSVFRVWREWPKAYPEPCSDGSMLFFGRLRRYKGLPAMQSIAEMCPEISFSIVGSPDAESAPLAEKLAAMDNVIVDAREVSETEMAETFASAKWILLPYESASQSGVVVDAYKYGRPVIVFGVGAVASQVVDGKTGIVVPAGDIEGFAEAVRRVSVMADSEYRSMCESAYAYGHKTYSAEGLSDDFADAFAVERKASEPAGAIQ